MVQSTTLTPDQYSPDRKAALAEIEARGEAEAKRVCSQAEPVKRRVNYICTLCKSHKSKNPTVYHIIKPGCEHNWVEEK